MVYQLICVLIEMAESILASLPYTLKFRSKDKNVVQLLLKYDADVNAVAEDSSHSDF